VSPGGLHLVVPGARLLPQYEEALEAGWSPDTERDISREQLTRLRRNRRAFLASLTRQDGTILTASGREVPRLPSQVFWLDDGEFCGVADFRFVPGSDLLPDYVPGHIGYSVVPWKRRRGYATRALGLVLNVARGRGLRRVQITCDEDNTASRSVILKNRGILTGTRLHEGERPKLVFNIDLTTGGGGAAITPSERAPI